MPVFVEALKFIQEDPGLNPAGKDRLISEIRRSKTPGQTIRWIKALMLFRKPSFEQSAILVRLETVKALIEGVKNRGQGNFSNLLEVFLPGMGSRAFVPEIDAFPSLIVDRIRGEEFPGIKTFLVELLFRSPGAPPSDIQPDDYRAGLHHPDEPLKGRILMLLEQKFKAEGLLAAARELGRITPPPSVFFFGTLRSLLSRYPNIVERLESIDIRPEGRLFPDRIELPSKARPREEGARFPGWRWRDRAEIIREGLLRREAEGLQKRLWNPEEGKAPEIGFPRDRLALITVANKNR